MKKDIGETLQAVMVGLIEARTSGRTQAQIRSDEIDQAYVQGVTDTVQALLEMQED